MVSAENNEAQLAAAKISRGLRWAEQSWEQTLEKVEDFY